MFACHPLGEWLVEAYGLYTTKEKPDDMPILTGPHPPHPDTRGLTDEEKLTFVEWIDLGAHWDGIPGEDEFSACRKAGIQIEGTQ